VRDCFGAFASRNDILLAVIASAAKQSRSSYVPQGAIFRLPSLIGDADGRRQADSIRRTLQASMSGLFASLWRKKAFPIDLYRSFAGRRPTPGIRGGADGGQRCSGECGRLRKVLAGSRYEIVNHPTISYELIVVEAETTAHR
jgi:hypothetical protein